MTKAFLVLWMVLTGFIVWGYREHVSQLNTQHADNLQKVSEFWHVACLDAVEEWKGETKETNQ